MKFPRVMIADDHTLLVEAFRRLLESKCEIVGVASDGRTLLESAPALKPDVIVLDISMPLLNGLEAARQLKALLPEVKIIFLTMNEDPDLAGEAMRIGAAGYLLKKSAASELFRAIQQAMTDKVYVTPQISRGLRELFIRNPQRKQREKSLTPRQREVIQLLAEGRSMKQAADVLKVTPRTVAFHKYRIMEGLGLKTSAELVQYAIKNRILVA